MPKFIFFDTNNKISYCLLVVASIISKITLQFENTYENSVELLLIMDGLVEYVLFNSPALEMLVE